MEAKGRARDRRYRRAAPANDKGASWQARPPMKAVLLTNRRQHITTAANRVVPLQGGPYV